MGWGRVRRTAYPFTYLLVCLHILPACWPDCLASLYPPRWHVTAEGIEGKAAKRERLGAEARREECGGWEKRYEGTRIE